MGFEILFMKVYLQFVRVGIFSCDFKEKLAD